ncbi:RNA-directed DNA polymerase, LTR Retrotransposon [Trachipleistophora hominis]|uniref:RNA-directed DNA polymerase, LTR Retrotransposon n=1 Tax=Trachipleistophora hominis TaxID=72359 RepID=L7JYP5_TRAHO|nr:RNA-directed DNA polymerase, LTR Retrotransposon [Trachipleistophora hominis]
MIKKGIGIRWSLKDRVSEYLKRLERKRIIIKSKSDWRNPVKAIENPDDGMRIVSNLMLLNDLTEKDLYKIPDMKRIVKATTGSKNLTVLDLKEGYYQIEIEETDKHKTAFEFGNNVYEWYGMVMGFKNTPMIFQRVINRSRWINW